MTKKEFIHKAQPQPIALGGMPLSADPFLTRSGSAGWRWKGALFVKIGDEWVRALASVQLTAVGSKKWEADIDASKTPA